MREGIKFSQVKASIPRKKRDFNKKFIKKLGKIESRLFTILDFKSEVSGLLIQHFLRKKIEEIFIDIWYLELSVNLSFLLVQNLWKGIDLCHLLT